VKKPIIVISSILLFGIGLGLLVTASAEEGIIPSWIKNTAGWWSEGEVDLNADNKRFWLGRLSKIDNSTNHSMPLSANHFQI